MGLHSGPPNRPQRLARRGELRRREVLDPPHTQGHSLGRLVALHFPLGVRGVPDPRAPDDLDPERLSGLAHGSLHRHQVAVFRERELLVGRDLGVGELEPEGRGGDFTHHEALRRGPEERLPQAAVHGGVPRLEVERPRAGGSGLDHLLRPAPPVRETEELPGNQPGPPVRERHAQVAARHLHPALFLVGQHRPRGRRRRPGPGSQGHPLRPHGLCRGGARRERRGVRLRPSRRGEEQGVRRQQDQRERDSQQETAFVHGWNLSYGTGS